MTFFGWVQIHSLLTWNQKGFEEVVPLHLSREGEREREIDFYFFVVETKRLINDEDKLILSLRAASLLAGNYHWWDHRLSVVSIIYVKRTTNLLVYQEKKTVVTNLFEFRYMFRYPQINNYSIIWNRIYSPDKIICATYLQKI